MLDKDSVLMGSNAVVPVPKRSQRLAQQIRTGALPKAPVLNEVGLPEGRSRTPAGSSQPPPAPPEINNHVGIKRRHSSAR